jgi:type III restriction enzyme
MELKIYQERVINEVGIYLKLLSEQQSKQNSHASLDAWEECKRRFSVIGKYDERKNGLDKDLPTFCVKVPTGGGKTLLATHVLGLIYQSVLKSRNGAGMVLWVVPSDQIYKDTIKALRNRHHFYRESLEHALSRRIEVWEKHEIARLTPVQLASNLNILILKLASTNRETKDQLKFFQDSGGNIVQHFPAENDPEGHKVLKARVPNLDMIVDDPGRGEYLAKTSVGNLVRLCEPAVILDEGHKATSRLARDTIEGFNASIVVELSATPHDGANTLVRVTGQQLLDEQMIKLPINIANSNQQSWKDCLTQARDKREQLAKSAAKHFKDTGRLIRPLVLVQVERTGKDQRDTDYVHSEDVKEHLMQRLGVTEAAIAIKSSEKDDIEGIDLLDEGCPVEWIITKAALQEGWDCPFAYILVSLNNTSSQQSMTQLVGRILRQPDVIKTAYSELNESYVFCLKKKAEVILKEVKKALESEGYEGDSASVVNSSDPGSGSPTRRRATIRKEFKGLYRKPFEGKIYLPRFCVKVESDYESLDYYRHLISQVDVSTFDFSAIDWDLADAFEAANDVFFRMTLGQADLEKVQEQRSVSLENDDQVKAWMVANLPFDYYSHRQLREMVHKSVGRLFEITQELRGNLGLVKFPILERIKGLVQRCTDEQTEEAFRKSFSEDRLCFYLECIQCRFEIPETVEVRTLRQLVDPNNVATRKSLFDFVPNDLNEYEKSVALYLDNRPEVLWWYRNLVGPSNFSIQGYRRNRIYPDFIVQEGQESKPLPRVLVVESKGRHLESNPDTNYKRSVADYFEKLGRSVSWQELGEDFQNHQFRFQVLDEGEYADRDWRDELNRLLVGERSA